VLRHDHEAQEQEILFPAHLVEDSDKTIACARRSKKRLPPVTTESDKMEIVSAVVMLEGIAHGEKPAPLKTHKGAAPAFLAYNGYNTRVIQSRHVSTGSPWLTR
jgi:hypothetical protein